MSDVSTHEDLADEVKQTPDVTASAMLGEQSKPKPARAKTPKPFVGYLVTGDPGELVAQPKRGWYFLSPLDLSVKAAEDTRAGFQAMAPVLSPKPIYKVTIIFERLEDGGKS